MDAKCLQCGRTIEMIAGHRSRRYCSGECRQTAYRRRHGGKARPYKESRLSRFITAVSAMRKKWPNLGDSTYYLLVEVQERYGERLATKIGERILWEIERASNRTSGKNK
jgi:hypothetical protein